MIKGKAAPGSQWSVADRGLADLRKPNTNLALWKAKSRAEFHHTIPDSPGIGGIRAPWWWTPCACPSSNPAKQFAGPTATLP